MVTPAGMTWPLERVKLLRTLRRKEASAGVSQGVILLFWGEGRKGSYGGGLTEAGGSEARGLAEEAVELLHLLKRGARERAVGLGEDSTDLVAQLGDDLGHGSEVVEAGSTPSVHRPSSKAAASSRTASGGYSRICRRQCRGVNRREAESQLQPRNVLHIYLPILCSRLHNPLQHVVRLLPLRVVLRRLQPPRNDGLQEVQRLLHPLVETLDGRQVGRTEVAEPVHGVDVPHRVHDLDGVVDRGVDVLLGVAELGPDEDAARDLGDDAKELLVDVDLGPVGADGELVAESLGYLLSDGRVKTDYPVLVSTLAPRT